MPQRAYPPHLSREGLGTLLQCKSKIRRRSCGRDRRRGTSGRSDSGLSFRPAAADGERSGAARRIAIFWHIPWPNPESFEICPWQRELLDGLLGADLIGFHVRAHCNNFLNTVDHVLEARIDWEHFSVKRNDHQSSVLPFPISVEFSGENPRLQPAYCGEERSALLAGTGIEATFIGVGVDRVDYTKGIVERFQAVESFLERYPSYQGKFTFIQLGAPTRSHIKRYADFQAEVDAEANRINARFKRGRWSQSSCSTASIVGRRCSATTGLPISAWSPLCTMG